MVFASRSEASHVEFGHGPESASRGAAVWLLDQLREMGGAEVEAFLTWLADERQVASATQKPVLSALLFLDAPRRWKSACPGSIRSSGHGCAVVCPSS
ncbi:MAG: phage integrase N-terminal SAM-like domain-containing protein [Rhizobacter sp.]